ncbi:NUDIX hydrolase [Fibrella aestuarina BUZ 2]|uniref:NUDIX hydrolase n=1 Tax=Fibrella aestuarina BUZ 2 TaxID=1166018 RepID=I0KEZ0_9BACT|nr:NUDIX domain-containing protein [Fibrella aestuarina]CCH02693.1 NUDIX hydrolase [Fibrella aestuarina BUZ 2]
MHAQPAINYIHQLSIDCVIFGYQDKQLKVLVPKLDFRGDFWALPSGYILQDEGIDEAARRILEERTGLRAIYLEQFRVFGNAHRSNRDFMDRLLRQNEARMIERGLDRQALEWVTRRFVSIGYYALVDINKVIPQKNHIDESIEWYPIGQLPTLIMDHHDMVTHALDTLRLHLDEHLLAFNLLPETFTMKELQELYEAIFDKPFARNNFQKKMLDMNVLERLEKKFTGAANKAPYLYRWQRPERALIS